MLIFASMIYANFSIVLVSPINNTWTSSWKPDLAFNVTGNRAAYLCQVWHDGTGINGPKSGNFTIYNGTSSSTISGIDFDLATGIRWGVMCFDTIGNEDNFSILNFSINIDPIKPWINVTLPADNTLISDNHTNIQFSAFDTSLQVCEARVNGVKNATNATIGSGVFQTYKIGFLINSTYTWNIWCNDSAGNTATTTARNLYVGRVPDVTLAAPTDSGVLGSNAVTYNISSITADTNNSICSIYSNHTGTWEQVGGTQNMPNRNQTLFNIFTSEGYSLWNALCYPLGTSYPYISRFASANRTVIVDTTNPTITINTPADNANTRGVSTTDGYSVKINITVVDKNPDRCILRVNNTDNLTDTSITSGTPFLINFNASDALWTWNVYCNDSAGNVFVTDNRTVTIDTAMPTWTSFRNYSSNESCKSFDLEIDYTGLFNYTITYGTSIAAVTHKLTNGSFSAIHTPKIVFNDSEETTYYINITVCDQAGNCNGSDSRPPQVSIDSPIPICSGWNLWSVYDANITFKEIYDDSNADFVYWWNRTAQAWRYYSPATTEAQFIGLGYPEAVWIQSDDDTTWFRNKTKIGRQSAMVNVTSGFNYIGLYTSYTFGNLSDDNFKNVTGGDNILGTAINVTYYHSYNNTAQEFVMHIWNWTLNDLTEVGAVGNTLDVLHVYSINNITVNMSLYGYVNGSW